METLAMRIDERRKELGLKKTDIWKGAGLSSGAYAQWMNGSKLKGENLIKVARVLGVNPTWLETGKGEKFEGQVDTNAFHDRRKRPAQRPIPVISKIPAGGPKEIVDAYHAGAGMEELIPDAEVGPYTFGLIIDGPSMEPTFLTGDKVIIDPSVQPRPGDFVAFKCHGAHGEEDGSTFKQYRPRGMNAQGVEYFELVPLNEVYPTIRSDQVDCEICGTMVEHRRYRRNR